VTLSEESRTKPMRQTAFQIEEYCSKVQKKACGGIMNIGDMLSLSEDIMKCATHHFKRLVDLVKKHASEEVPSTTAKYLPPKHLSDQLTWAACLYLACKHSTQSRPLVEVLKACKHNSSKEVTKKQLGKRVLHLSYFLDPAGPKEPTMSKVVSYITQYANKMGCKEAVVQNACSTASTMEQLGLLDGSNPLSIASGILCVAISDEGTMGGDVGQCVASAMHVSSKTVEKFANKARSSQLN